MKEHAIYKYIKDGEIVYIGKTDNSLDNRILCHKKEPGFKKLGKMNIMYFMVKNSVETDIYEKILIDKYQPKLNKVYKNEDAINIVLEEPEWLPYDEERIKEEKESTKKEVKKTKKSSTPKKNKQNPTSDSKPKSNIFAESFGIFYSYIETLSDMRKSQMQNDAASTQQKNT